jgi:hypothetical protein
MQVLVSIAGYGGEGAKPTTLAAFFDESNSSMVALKEVPFREKADKGYAFVTNLRLENYDCLFTESHLQGAILAYREEVARVGFILADEVGKHRPRIETDGIDASGQKYRLHASMTNGEVAVLALAHFQSRQRSVGSLTNQMDKMADLYNIRSI